MENMFCMFSDNYHMQDPSNSIPFICIWHFKWCNPFVWHTLWCTLHSCPKCGHLLDYFGFFLEGNWCAVVSFVCIFMAAFTHIQPQRTIFYPLISPISCTIFVPPYQHTLVVRFQQHFSLFFLFVELCYHNLLLVPCIHKFQWCIWNLWTYRHGTTWI